MPDESPARSLSAPLRARNARPALPSFFLDPKLYRAFPARRRAPLVALYNLLLAFGRNSPRGVLETQPELAELLGVTVRQVRNLERDLEDLGAVRSHRDLEGLRGGRALELVPIEEWIPEELWTGPRIAPDSRDREMLKTCGEAVDNSARAEPGSGEGGTVFRPQARFGPIDTRARQSTTLEEVTRAPAGKASSVSPAPAVARRLFGFLAKRTGLAGRRWRDALPALEELVRDRGEAGAWSEVERIAVAARSAVNPGGYAFACLWPEGAPEVRGSTLRALEVLDNAGPLFRSLDGIEHGKADALGTAARSTANTTPRASSDENTP